MLTTILFLFQTGVELVSNLFTILIGGPLVDAFFDPIDILISGFLAFA